MKTLLYATDFSENSIPAFHYANMIRERLHAKLYVFHAFDMKATFISTVSLSYAKREEHMLKEQAEKLERFCLDLLGVKMLPNGIIPLVGENTIPYEGILQKGESLNADLLVIGTKGSRTLSDLLLGSTATALINKSFIPVLSIPGETSISPIKIIMYASAFEEADILAIRRLIGLAEPFKAHLKLVHVSTSKEYAGEDQMAWFKEMLQSKVSYKDITYELHTSEEVTQTLMNCAEKADVSILAMLERENEGVFKKLWHSDTVKKMNKASRRPLLSFNKKNI